MDGKIAVQFDDFKVTRYAYQKLKYCKLCGRYTVLGDDTCPGCGRKKKIVSIDSMFDITVKRRFQIDVLVLLMLFFTGIVLAGSLYEIYVMAASGIALCVLFLCLAMIFRKSERAALMLNFFNKYYSSIFNGLKKDADAAGEKMASGDFKGAYEDMREVGVLLKNDAIKVSKLVCLSRFILRKDADLELETLILPEYNLMLVNYINEASRLNRKLIKRNVIDYVIANENRILEGQGGTVILGNVAGAAIRTRQNVIIYKDFIMRYLKFMRKDRLARLYKLLNEGYTDELYELHREVEEIIRRD